MKFNSHPPNGVFIKAVTITASRRARPARLGRVGTYCTRREGTEEEDGRQRATVRKREGGCSVNEAAEDWGSQQQGDRGA